MKLIIGSKRYSTWSLRPWLLLKHFDIAFDEVIIPFEMKPGVRELTDDIQAAMRATSPNGRVPVLHADDGSVINESFAICDFISEVSLDGTGWPSNRRHRFLAKSACLEMATGFFNLRRLMPMSIGSRAAFAGPPPAAAVADIQRVLSILSTCLSQRPAGSEFLLGSFGIVDAFYAPVLQRFATYNTELPAPVREYSERMSELPAVREWCRAALSENVKIEEIEEIVRQYPRELESSCKI